MANRIPPFIPTLMFIHLFSSTGRAILPPRTAIFKTTVAKMHPYAIGFENAPEQRVPVDLTIKGEIPSWLSGVLYRTGPGTYRIPSFKDHSRVVDIQHWFDGLSMNHRFEIHPGGQRVSYRSRKASEDYERQISEHGKIPGIAFGQQPDICQSIFRKFFTVFQQMRSPPTSSGSPSGANVQVTLTPDMPGWGAITERLPELKQHQHSGPQYLVAKTDADGLQLVDPISLEPLAVATYKTLDPRLDGQLSAAHSCRDKEANEFYNYTCKLGGRFPTYKVFRIKGDNKVDVLAEIKDAPASYLHSFAMTSKYVILAVWQAHITGYGMSILYNQNIAQSIDKKWNPKMNSLFYIIDKASGGVVAKYETPPFFCFHQLNAFDDPVTDDIILDMSVYEDHSVIDSLYLNRLRNLTAENPMLMGRARRFRLSNVTSPSSTTRIATVEFTLPQSESIELPTINPAKYHRPYRYAYGINKLDPRAHHTFADRIIKLDMENIDNGHKVWGIPGYTPSEPIFVPRPGAKDEDDGVVLSVVLDGDRRKSLLIVLDAKDMKECARAEMETAFPIGFHGLWSQSK
ncbi:retinal pigment epithelial membrane family protein [Moniliophthora roreri MCA 2997]|uniref:Retinal pigment epithelial membrane family protein n=2 Tax=Moniliophthora roreri TaxID=221103 RepID=V2WX78_MONRO|nr:retinal pigment epithelial membrane family protein [Moniliophthora roreri MCA 2997]KAI3605863.1 retinal pigment epithelial membrane family protein [Moniliophthora roreri]